MTVVDESMDAQGRRWTCITRGECKMHERGHRTFIVGAAADIVRRPCVVPTLESIFREFPRPPQDQARCKTQIDCLLVKNLKLKT